MKKAIVVTSDDMREILAEKFGVPQGNVIKSQYSWTIIMEPEVTNDDDP